MSDDHRQDEYLLLKWGTIKGYRIKSERGREILKEYLELGASMSCMAQEDSPKQKQLICELISVVDGPITSDWTGEDLTKEEAIEYITTYGK